MAATAAITTITTTIAPAIRRVLDDELELLEDEELVVTTGIELEATEDVLVVVGVLVVEGADTDEDTDVVLL